MSQQRFEVPLSLHRERIDKALATLVVESSRATLQRWIEEGRVLIDGAPCRARDKVRAGSVILLEPGPAPPTDALPDETVKFEVLYSDDDLIVVDKPAGLVVHPAKGHETGTLVNGLLAKFGGKWATGDPSDPIAAIRPGIVHRIDKDTSGVLVVARSERAREGLKSQLSSHSMRRRYLAITVGVPAKAQTISTLYGRHPKARLKWSSQVKEGKLAVSHFNVLEVFGSAGADTSSMRGQRGSAPRPGAGRAALVECQLETGRTHQIRVHLSEQCRTPLLADALYGHTPHDAWLAEAEAAIGRQALHAESLGFTHPVTGSPLSFRSELPADFARALAILRTS